jgi:hypothetical protein
MPYTQGKKKSLRTLPDKVQKLKLLDKDFKSTVFKINYFKN